MPGRRKKRNYSNDDVQFAKELYLRNLSYNDIAKQMRERTNKKCSPMTVMRWAREFAWDIDKGKAQIVAAAELQEGVYDLVKETRDHLDAYKEMREVGQAGLLTDIKSGKDAADMINMGIRGEREIAMGLMHMAFLADVAQVVEEEIRDPDTRLRIANRFRQLAAKWASMTGA